MARLSAKARRGLPAKDFAGPNRSFPLNDEAHVRAARSLERFASSATKRRIDAKAKATGVGKGARKGAGKGG